MLVTSVCKRQVTSKNSLNLSSPNQTQEFMLSLTSLFLVFSTSHTRILFKREDAKECRLLSV